MTRVMLLIDADNVSTDVMEQAVERLLAEHGVLHVRRAYCTAESAVKHQALFKRLSIRPIVNLAAGKNSTDIALAVDALDLAISERPDLMVIASSDSDFAPLVSRLREKGCRVQGIGQHGKTGAETQQIYDGFTVLTHRGEPASAPAARKTASPRARKAAAPRARKATGASTPAAVPVPPAKLPSALAPPPPPPPPAPPPLPDAVRSILAALPELHRGQVVELRVAAERLRDAGLLGARASSTKFFAPLVAFFELLPPDQPNKVRRREGI